MPVRTRSPGNLFRTVGWGAIYGLGAWSAYAAVEFVCSSLLFGFTRPYSTFTPWHWQLTWLLIPGFFAAGLVAGALAGLAVFGLRNTGIFQDDEPAVLESAATLTLVLAFLLHALVWPRSWNGWYGLVLACLAFSLLLLAGMRSAKWQERTGFLTNPWVVSGLLLGLGQEAILLDFGVAEQLGAGVRRWASVLAILLLAVAAGSVVAGNLARRRWPSLSRFRLVFSAAAPVVAVALVAASQLLTSSHPLRVEAATTTSAPAGRPNVLLMVLDTVRADHLSLYGYSRKTTPNLEKLAHDSTVYTHATSAADITLTSHASLFTGMYPSWHGAYCQPPEAAYGRRLSDKVPTLAELLARQQYSTLAVAANLYLRAAFGLERGFQTFDIPRPVPVLTAENWYFLRRPLRRALSYGFDTAQFDRLFSRGEDIDRELLDGMDQLKNSPAPFFAFVNYMDAHFPYVPPAPFDVLFPGKNRRLTQDDLDLEQQQIAGGGPVPANYRPHAISQYDGGIAYLDAQVGKVVDWLRQRHLYDNTMIIVTSDHGEAFGDRGRTGHGNSPYQNLLHVALLIKYPHASSTGVVDTPVSLTDVAPTVLDRLGIAAPASMQGRSLLQPPVSGQELFSETFPCAVLQSPECPRGCTARAVFSWPHKFITSTNGKRQLFDLSADPDETRDLSPALAPLAQQLNSDLRVWLKAAPVQPRQNVQLDKESARRLKSLGYVQ